MLSTDLLTTFDGNRNVLLSSDVVSVDPQVGLELGYKKTVFLRTGLNNVQDIKNFDGTTYRTAQLNFGLGFKIKNFMIDYALSRSNVDSQAEELYSNIFSLKASFK